MTPNKDLAVVSESMFHKAVKDYKLTTMGTFSSQGFIEVFDGHQLAGYSERGVASYDYYMNVKYLINHEK